MAARSPTRLDGAASKRKTARKVRAYVLRAFDIVTNRQKPGLAIIAFKTDEGENYIAVDRGTLEKLAALATRVAGQLPDAVTIRP